MKKKLFATLGALCLGVILCVSSVFAVNWWYSINNTAGPTTITMGQTKTLTVSGAGGQTSGAYQQSVVKFNDVAVEVPAWDPATGTLDHTQAEFPTYKLTLTVKEKKNGEDEFAALTADFLTIKVTSTAGTAVASAAAAATQDIVTGIDANATVTITVEFADTIAAEWAQAQFQFEITVAGEDGGTHL